MIGDNYEWSSVNRVFDDALYLIVKRRDTFMYQKQISSKKIDKVKLIFHEANERVQGLNT